MAHDDAHGFDAVPELLDPEVWEAPRRLSRRDSLNYAGGPCRRDWRPIDDIAEDEPR